jgi:hypothetical protein
MDAGSQGLVGEARSSMDDDVKFAEQAAVGHNAASRV